MHADILREISSCIVTATIFAFAAKWTRQPLILGYIAAGIVIGPAQGLGWLASPEDIETISELGLILLLFMIGLEINLKKLREAGKAVLAVGVGQFLICVTLGLAVMPLLGFRFGEGHFAPLYMAVAAALSSTMIVVKLLYDKFELDTLPGRITLGILVFQDIWAILFLALQPNLENPAPLALLFSLAKGVGLVAMALLLSRFALPVLFRSIAKLPELMLIGALAWCFGISMLAAWLGLSREMGALIAGIAISTFPYNLDVIAKVVSLRDFFITLFFVTLGAKIPQPTWDIVLVSLGGSLFVMLSRILSITPILALMGCGNRTSVIPAINLAQVSEFSLVIGALGVGLGHIDAQVLTVIVFMMVFTSVVSTYGIQYNYEIFRFLNPGLRQLGMRDLHAAPVEAAGEAAKEIVFLGFSRYTSSLLHELMARDPGFAQRIAVVDFNPEVKLELERRGIDVLYGDISHADTLRHARVAEAQVVVCTLPDSMLKGTANARLLTKLQAMAPAATIILTAEFFYQARELYQRGASYVFMPRLMGAADVSNVVLAALEGGLEELRTEATAGLESRLEVLP